jgi:hypothetical protein
MLKTTGIVDPMACSPTRTNEDITQHFRIDHVIEMLNSEHALRFPSDPIREFHL